MGQANIFVIPHQPDLSLTAEPENEWSEPVKGYTDGETFQFKTWEHCAILCVYKRINNPDYIGGYKIIRTFFGSDMAKEWLADITAETGRKPFGWAFE